jgi:hypothetical protein
MRRIFIAVFLCTAPLSFSQDADALFAQGVKLLKESESNQTAVLPAAKALSKAAILFDLQNNEAKVAECNSYLYWTKKKMNLDNATAFVASEGKASIAYLETVSKAVPHNEAEKMLAEAQKFEKDNAGEPLLVAVRYFEIADRFKGTDASLKAQAASLKAMQTIKKR